MTDEDIISDILRREGGWTDHPADKGGPTNRGITLERYSEWLGRGATESELRALTEEEARRIYRRCYISAPGFLAVEDDMLRGLLIDCAVLNGPKNAVKFLQRALDGIEHRVYGPGLPHVVLKDDGKFGPVTRAALDAVQSLGSPGSQGLFVGVLAQRLRFFGRLITDHPDQAVFAAGWLDRVAEFVEQMA